MTSPNEDPIEITEPASDGPVNAKPSSPPRRLLPNSRTSARGAGGKDTPPRSSRSRAKAKSEDGPKEKAEFPEYVPGKIGEGLTQLYGGIGMMLGMWDPHCGGIIVSNAQSMAASMEKLAKESPATRAFLEKLITTSAIGEVVAAHLPVVTMIAAHHIPALRNRMDPGMQGHGNMGAPGATEHGQAA